MTEDLNKRMEDLIRQLRESDAESAKEYVGTCSECGADISSANSVGGSINQQGAVGIGGRWQRTTIKVIHAKRPKCGAALARSLTRVVGEGQIVSTWSLDPERRW